KESGYAHNLDVHSIAAVHHGFGRRERAQKLRRMYPALQTFHGALCQLQADRAPMNLLGEPLILRSSTCRRSRTSLKIRGRSLAPARSASPTSSAPAGGLSAST